MAGATLEIAVEAAPKAPEPKVFLRVTSHGEAFRRAGHCFTKQAQVIACTAAEAKLIWAEDGKQLKVDEASESDFGKQPKSDAERLAESASAMRDARAQLEAAEAEKAALAKANADAAARIVQLEGIGAKSAARIAELEAALAKANADLDALTAPKADAQPAPEQPKTKPAKG